MAAEKGIEMFSRGEQDGEWAVYGWSTKNTEQAFYWSGIFATIFDPQSGRKMEVFTNEPCVHFFTASFAKGADIGKFSKPYILRESFAVETQGFPHINRKKDYQSTVLKPGENYYAKTIFRFSNVF